ncbi:MAG: hypothetical protein DRJ56_02295 [Thermoprotei archaeon]|nr:MAG: hypothetical protein DRJ56_02295 [Thermoprotei archaeon]
MRSIKRLSAERAIVVACGDARVYYEVVRELKRHSIRFAVAREPRAKLVADALITDSPPKGSGLEVVDVRRVRPGVPLLLDVCRALLGESILNEVVLGVDPGEEMGVVLVADGVLVLGFSTRDPSRLAEVARGVVEYGRYREFVAKVGSSPGCASVVAALTKAGCPRVRLVDESRVSGLARLYSRVLGLRDENVAAAYAICLA